MKKVLCAILAAAAVFSVSGCGGKEKLYDMTETPGITPTLTVADGEQTPQKEVQKAGVKYTLTSDGSGYIANIDVGSENVSVVPYICDVPVVAFARVKSLTLRRIFFPDGLESMDILGFSAADGELFIPASVAFARGFGFTDCPVYFARKKADLRTAGENALITTVLDGSDRETEPFGVFCKRQSAEEIAKTPQQMHGAWYYGLGAVYGASCLRFLEDDGEVLKEIPFANELSEIDDVSGKLCENGVARYRLSVSACDLPDGTWYYLDETGRKIRFGIKAIDLKKQQIISLYRA